MNTLKRFLSGFVLFFFIIANVLAEPATFAAEMFGIYFDGAKSYFLSDAKTVVEAARDGSGGVMFQAVAEPEDRSLENQPITLTYNDRRADGERLEIIIGSKKITAKRLYDWMLLPTAQFADSPYYTCMTLLDSPKDKAEEELYEADMSDGEKNVYFAAYHTALSDTLVGLTCYLVDAMLMNPGIAGFTHVLPKLEGYNDREWHNENEPNYVYNESMDRISADHATKVDLIRRGMYEKLGIEGRSYVYSDDNVNIRFRVEDDEIKFTGAPYYQFVNLFYELPKDDDEAEKIVRGFLALAGLNEQEIEKELKAMSREAVMANATAKIKTIALLKCLEDEILNKILIDEMTEIEAKDVLVRMLIDENTTEAEAYEIRREINAFDEIDAKEELEWVMDDMITEGINEDGIVGGMRMWEYIVNAMVEILPNDIIARVEKTLSENAKKLTDAINRDPELVRLLNPVIFDTAEKTAQWAAFFRFVKNNKTSPNAWGNFMAQIKNKILINQDYQGEDPNEVDPDYRYVIDAKYKQPTPRRFHVQP
jgi:hypothetical protein